MVYAYFAAFRKDVDYRSYIDYTNDFNFGTHTIHMFLPEEINYYRNLTLFFELCFLIEFISQFFTSYHDRYNQHVRDLSLIYKRYLRG